jgi:hypothetical protein
VAAYDSGVRVRDHASGELREEGPMQAAVGDHAARRLESQRECQQSIEGKGKS